MNGVLRSVYLHHNSRMLRSLLEYCMGFHTLRVVHTARKTLMISWQPGKSPELLLSASFERGDKIYPLLYKQDGWRWLEIYLN